MLYGSDATYLEKIQTSFATSRIIVSLIVVVSCGLPFVVKRLDWKGVLLYRGEWRFFALRSKLACLQSFPKFLSMF